MIIFGNGYSSVIKFNIFYDNFGKDEIIIELSSCLLLLKIRIMISRKVYLQSKRQA